MIKLDYSLNTPQERLELVKQILEETPNPAPAYLEILADYLIFCMEKEEKKEKKILTENRLATVNKRETSYEGLVSQFENGEDGVYNITNEDKHVIFQPKISITKQDRIDIPELEQTDSAIAACLLQKDRQNYHPPYINLIRDHHLSCLGMYMNVFN